MKPFAIGEGLTATCNKYDKELELIINGVDVSGNPVHLFIGNDGIEKLVEKYKEAKDGIKERDSKDVKEERID